MQKDKNEKDINDWSAEEIASEATNKPDDEIKREMLRGDETEGDADERDVVGSVKSEETAHGSKEAKKNNTEKNK